MAGEVTFAPNIFLVPAAMAPATFATAPQPAAIAFVSAEGPGSPGGGVPPADKFAAAPTAARSFAAVVSGTAAGTTARTVRPVPNGVRILIREKLGRNGPEDVNLDDIRKLERLYNTQVDEQALEIIHCIAVSGQDSAFKPDVVESAIHSYYNGPDPATMVLSPGVRVEPSSNLVAYLDALLTREKLVAALGARRSAPLDMRPDLVSRALAARYASNTVAAPFLARRAYYLAPFATFFGRYHHVISAMGGLSNGGGRIMEVGPGLYPMESINTFLASVGLDTVRETTRRGFVYEPFELAGLAGAGGQVDVVDFSRLPLFEVANARDSGLLISLDQLGTVQNKKVSELALALENEEANKAFNAWQTYIGRFMREAGTELGAIRVRGASGREIDVGYTLRVRSDGGIARVNTIQADIAEMKLRGVYDAVWLTNVFQYLSEDIFLSFLARAVSHLPVAGEGGSKGGLLVVNRFDLHKLLAGSPMAGCMGGLLTLLGMAVESELPSPFERQATANIVIARRTHRSQWLDASLDVQRQLGLE